MFKLNEIKELIKLLDQTSIQELEIQNEGTKLCIRKPNITESVMVASTQERQYYSASSQQIAPFRNEVEVAATLSPPVFEAPGNSEIEQAKLHRIVSPMIGTFYQASSPNAASFVKIGDKVTEKTVVCIVEAMKLMNDIVADTNGQIVEILVENGQMVEYGQPLFLVKTD